MSNDMRKGKSLYATTSNSFGTGEAVTITPNDVSGLPTGNIVLTFDRSVAGKIERIKGSISGSNFVVASGGRGYDGTTEQAHTSPVVEYIYNGADQNDAVDAFVAEHSVAGVHDATKVAMLAGTQTFIGVKTLASPVINTGISGTAIDTDGTLAANSDTLLPSQKAVKTYVTASVPSLSADGWTAATGTWTYASATTITVPSGAAAKYQVGDKFKLTANSVVLYGYIITVADTLLTVKGNSLTNHVFTANYYSHELSPVGFPQWFAYTPTYTGFSADPTTGSSRFTVRGRTCLVQHSESATGTSNATTMSITLPITAVTSSGANWCGMAQVRDNGTVQTNAGLMTCTSGGTVINVYKDYVGTNWTGSGNKQVVFGFIEYEI